MAARKTTTRKATTGRGKGTRAAGGKQAAKPAASSTRSQSKRGEKRLSPLDRVNRARRIAAARAQRRPKSWPTIAKDEGISERQCRRIYDDWLGWQRIESTPDRLVDDTLALIEASIIELDDVIRAAADDGNHNARVGAIRLLLDTLMGRWDVMRNAGRLPASMTRFRQGQEAQIIFEAMVRVLRRHDVGQEVLDELMAVIEGETEPPALGAGDVVEASAVAA